MKQAVLYLHDDCSYTCSYCLLKQDWYKPRLESRAADSRDRERIIAFFEQCPGWNIILTGGEPTELSGFVEFAESLARNNFISLDTNNSLAGRELDKLMEAVPPARVKFIRCSLHEADEGEERLEQWLDRAKRIRDAGYPTFAAWVAAPDKLSLLPSLYQRFDKRGVPLVVTPLITDKYPAAYTEVERALLNKYMISAVFRAQLDNPSRQVRGSLCAAGHTRIRINAIDGSIYPCFRSNKPLGNVYLNELELSPAPRPCPHDGCSWYFEPHQLAESLVVRDLAGILAGRKDYDRDIYRQLPRLGIEV